VLEYQIVIAKTATGYSAHCPDVPGCATVGKTIEQTVANMKKALELHFEGLAEDGDPIPKAGGVEAYPDLLRDLDLTQYFLGHVQVDTTRFAAVVSHS
jgi:predicted RNase H-like HicB family nuclease